VVEAQLVKPLSEKEAHQNRFSRSYIPPQARRVRVLEQGRSTDGRGAEFVVFAVDQRSGAILRKTADDESLHVGIAHAAAPDRLEALTSLVRHVRPRATIDMATMLGPVIGTHAGPGTVGFFWFHDRD